MTGTRAAAPEPPSHLLGLDRYETGLPIEEVRRRLGGGAVVKLASNENPSGPSPRAVEAARSHLDRLHRYPDGPATALREALALRTGVAPEEVVVGNGSTDLIDLLARASLGPGHNAVVSRGAFARYRQVVAARNGNVREVAMRGFTHDLEAMRAAVDADTRLMFVANPNNPTGSWNGREEVEALAERLPFRVLLVLDQAYFEYAEEPEYPGGVELVRRGGRVAVLRTFSKVYGLAGLRIGDGLAPRDVVEAVDTVREPFNSNAIGQVAALAALEDQDHVRRAVALNRSERTRVTEALAARGLGVLPSLANFVFVDTGRPGSEVFEALLARGIIVRPLGSYGFDTALRVSIGLPEENDALLRALDDVLV
jgi:histidinol-phosphate aminotransferase